MVRITGSKGKSVNVEIQGIAETKRLLEKTGQMIEKGADVALLKSSNLIVQEVQESIIGNRAEKRSVESGKLANSITTQRQGDTAVVFASSRKYPGTTTTTQDVALFLEVGTTKIAPRRHFANTKARNEKKVADIFKDEISKAI